MRSMLALGLLITLCASAAAATAHRSKPPTERLRARQHVIVRPARECPPLRALPSRVGQTNRRSIGWIVLPPALAADSGLRPKALWNGGTVSPVLLVGSRLAEP